MTTESPGPRRMASSLERSARLKEEIRARQGQAPAPGDLFVLRITADLPVEWALLERGSGGKLLAVPADSGPPAGTADVEVPADAPGGPLSLRCRFRLWLDASLFEPELRSGVIGEQSVAEALHSVHQIESGSLDVSPLAEEVDADPEYQDWIRDVSERARSLAFEARPAERPRSSGGSSWRVVHQLAAALAILAIGLSVWVAMLRREVDRLSQPIVDLHWEDVVLGGATRGGRTVEVPRDASHILLLLTVDSLIEEPEGRFEIVNRQGKTVWRSRSPVNLTLLNEVPVVLPRQMLPDGLYHVRLLPASGGEPLGEEILKIETRD
jgi:hypothetical protein